MIAASGWEIIPSCVAAFLQAYRALSAPPGGLGGLILRPWVTTLCH